ncbi:MAG TPA: hypothetical protein G4N92_07875, partial [Anaerolineae bacterium]|nr:hypothetical protein [Anaerolineae bacterium]
MSGFVGFCRLPETFAGAKVVDASLTAASSDRRKSRRGRCKMRRGCHLQVLQEICLTEGIPQSIYMDKRLTSRKRVSLVEQLAGKEPKSQF